MKAAKGILILSLITVLCLGLMGTGMAAGGNGYGRGGGSGVGVGSGGTGTCINSNIAAAEYIDDISGTVSNVGYYGQGIAIDTGEEVVTVYGIGPIRYWEDVLDVARPAVGDEILVTAKEVTFSDGTVKIIVFTVTFSGSETEYILRDDETGLPLWRGGFGRGQRLQTGECPNS